jgi:hypothetical protein
VVHYDLSWNPTRHEQREGRVDRYGQNRPNVRVLTYYGLDNQIDGVVLDVLLRKHKTIRSALGISVPVPVDTEQVIQAVFEGLLLRGQKPTTGGGTLILPGMEDYFTPQLQSLIKEWEASSEREKRSRSLFAQEALKSEEVGRELQAVHAAIGSGVDTANFTRQALSAFGASVGGVTDNGVAMKVDFSEVSPVLQDRLFIDPEERQKTGRKLKFSLPVAEDELYLPRTHPFLEGLANHILETSLDPLSGDAQKYPAARRSGAIRTKEVSTRTTLLLLRLRYHLQHGVEAAILAEECLGLAFAGAPDEAQWLSADEAEGLLGATPGANIAPEQAAGFVRQVVEGMDFLQSALEETARQRAGELLQAHERVRRAARLRGGKTQVEPQLPVDILGIYVFLPA